MFERVAISISFVQERQVFFRLTNELSVGKRNKYDQSKPPSNQVQSVHNGEVSRTGTFNQELINIRMLDSGGPREGGWMNLGQLSQEGHPILRYGDPYQSDLNLY